MMLHAGQPLAPHDLWNAWSFDPGVITALGLTAALYGRGIREAMYRSTRGIVQLKRERPSWGAPKIREKLRRLHSDIPIPAISTVHAVLDRHGLVNHARKRRYKAQGTTLSHPSRPNDLWCADYKGEFMLADRRYCYPLTITDFASRYLISCDALATG